MFRRKLFFVSILLVLILLAGLILRQYYPNDDYEELVQYCVRISGQLEDKEFSWARFSKGEIQLFARDGTATGTMRPEHWDKRLSRRILGIERMEHAFYFVLYGAVDDRMGILIPDEASNHILHGINKLERIGGRSFKYEK